MLRCLECGDSLESLESLEGHISMEHLGWLPYQCTYCRTYRSSQAEIRRHIQYKHYGNNESFIFHPNDENQRELAKMVQKSTESNSASTSHSSRSSFGLSFSRPPVIMPLPTAISSQHHLSPSESPKSPDGVSSSPRDFRSSSSYDGRGRGIGITTDGDTTSQEGRDNEDYDVDDEETGIDAGGQQLEDPMANFYESQRGRKRKSNPERVYLPTSTADAIVAQPLSFRKRRKSNLTDVGFSRLSEPVRQLKSEFPADGEIAGGSDATDDNNADLDGMGVVGAIEEEVDMEPEQEDEQQLQADLPYRFRIRGNDLPLSAGNLASPGRARCEICLVYVAHGSRKSHVVTKHIPGDKIFCHLCDFKCSGLVATVVNHYKVRHPNDPKEFKNFIPDHQAKIKELMEHCFPKTLRRNKRKLEQELRRQKKAGLVVGTPTSADKSANPSLGRQCMLCDKRPAWGTERNHVITHHIPGDKIFCHVCDFKCSGLLTTMTNHFKVRHREIPAPYDFDNRLPEYEDQIAEIKKQCFPQGQLPGVIKGMSLKVQMQEMMTPEAAMDDEQGEMMD